MTRTVARSPVRLLTIMILSVFGAELTVMVAIWEWSGALAGWGWVLVDAGTLTILLGPLLYLFLFRPLVSEIAERERAEAALQRTAEELERRVEERTVELARANERLRDELAHRTRVQATMQVQLAALNAAANAIVITDRDGVILWVNPAFTALTGHTADETRGKTPRILQSGAHDQAFYEHLWTTILSGRVWEGEFVNRRKDGSTYVAGETITPVRSAAGEIHHFIGIQQDVTARKQADAEMQRQRDAAMQRNKLAAMGELLAGVAHELNNPLSVVTGYAKLLQTTVKDGPLADRVTKIMGAADRCARIVKNFLALARQYPPERSRAGLNRIVRDAVELLAYQLRVDDVEVRCELPDDLPDLWADPHQLHQVVVNLISNAHHAMREVPAPRRLTLATRYDATRGKLTLSVADTGPGIAPAAQKRIFEPFFTTKPPGQGTGLGLSLCQGIVEAHGGAIRLENEGTGRGATFLVELPVGEMPAPEAEARGAASVPRNMGKTVLVVDDEPEVANVLAEMLAVDGHQVETAGNGVEALEKLDERDYDLILSDIKMPGLDGPGLYQELERRTSRLHRRMIFLTGDTLSRETREFLERAAVPSVSKPVDHEEVRTLVQRVLTVTGSRNE